MPIEFNPNDISQAFALTIVKSGLENPGIHQETKVMAIQKVAEMETHNSVTKADLVAALRWLFLIIMNSGRNSVDKYRTVEI